MEKHASRYPWAFPGLWGQHPVCLWKAEEKSLEGREADPQSWRYRFAAGKSLGCSSESGMAFSLQSQKRSCYCPVLGERGPMPGEREPLWWEKKRGRMAG